MVPEAVTAVGFGRLVVDNHRLVEENTVLRKAVEDMNAVLQAAVDTLGLSQT